jgi:hypothetical protein
MALSTTSLRMQAVSASFAGDDVLSFAHKG